MHAPAWRSYQSVGASIQKEKQRPKSAALNGGAVERIGDGHSLRR